MDGINLISTLLGAAIGVVVSVVGFFLNQYILFRTKILVPPTYDQDRFYFNFIADESSQRISVGGVSSIIKVKGLRPARGVEIFVDGHFNNFSINPETPYQIDTEKQSIKIGVLNPGLYEVEIQNRNASYDTRLSIKSVESTDAIEIKRGVAKKRFIIDPKTVPTFFLAIGIATMLANIIAILASK